MPRESNNIICVVVTYNRISLLKECIEALKNQTIRPSRIIIVNNNSTDGTNEYLGKLSEDELYKTISLPENIGGAGGFSTGIKEAALEHADWIWLMDDDTLPTPDCLEKMLPFTREEKVGFICSKVVWTDGQLHKMNAVRTDIDQSRKTEIASSTSVDSNCFLLTNSCSFVSVLINGHIPWKLGLPYKEFFIWCDDAEYTERITSNGYDGIYATDSVAIHKTKENYESSMYTIPASASWKLFYGVRNEAFRRRKRRGWLRFIFSHLYKFYLHAHHIKKRKLPKAEERLLLEANRRGLWAALTFSPKIDYLAPNKSLVLK